MIQLGQCTGFAHETFGKLGVFADFPREYFQSDVAVELRLTRFVNGSHTPLAQQLNDFELREILCQFLGGRGDEARMARGRIDRRVSGRLRVVALETLSHQAFRADEVRGVGGKLSAALGALSQCGHFRVTSNNHY